MTNFRKIFRIKDWLWRNVFGKIYVFFAKVLLGVDVGGRATVIGVCVFKGRGVIKIGNNCILASNKYANPLGLKSACIFESIELESKIIIGNNFSASGVVVIAKGCITIGNNVSVGANSCILDSDLHSIESLERRLGHVPKCEDIRIEDDVWIGMNVVILKGVTIGRESVIGANAVVTKNIPSRSVVAGNPAKIIKSI